MQSCTLTRLRNYALVLLPLLGFLISPAGAVKAQSPAVAHITLTPAMVFWQPHVTYGTLVLTVSAPDGQVHRQEFGMGETVAFFSTDATGLPLPDGSYIYELRVIPAFDPSVKQALLAAREVGDDTLLRELQQRGIIPRQPFTQTGGFTISGGGILYRE